MGDHRADYRAKDADRQRYVEAIEEAWVDGELGEQDRELRVARALTAETLDELAALTRDLQHQPAPVVVRRSQPVVVAADPTPPATSALAQTEPEVSHRVMGGIAAAIVAVAVVGTLGFARDPSSIAQGTAVDVPVEVWGDGGTGVDRGFRMRPRDLREAAAAYESRFGTSEAYRVDYRPRSVVVQSPAGRSGDRVATWVWDGTTWTRQADSETGSTTAPATGTVDIAEVAPGPLVDNVRVARGALRVEDGRFTRATVLVGEDGAPVVEIHVSNTFNEAGFLTTTPAGEILRRDPYAR